MPQVIYHSLNLLLALPDTVIGSELAALSLVAIIVVRLYCSPAKSCQANIGDLAITLYMGLQVYTLHVSRSFPNSVHFIVPIITAACAYFSVRLLHMGGVSLVWFLRAITIIAFPIAFVDTYLLVHGIESARIFPGEYLTALHASLPVLGAPTRNDGLMVVLAALPYTMASWALERARASHFQLFSLGAATAIIAVLLLSFSRGVYMALAAFLCWIFAFMARNRSLLCKPLGIFCLTIFGLTGGLIVSVHAQRSVADTILGSKTLSQRRSALGRVDIWRESFSGVRQHLLLGSGGYADGYNSLARLKNSSEPFTARAYNAVIEVAESSGLLGLLAYGAFILFPLCKAMRRLWSRQYRNNDMVSSAILTSGALALLVRDMTYSSLVLSGITMVLAWILIGLLQNSLDQEHLIGDRL